MTVSTTEQDAVLKLIDEQELVDLALAMGNIKAPSGYEHQWWISCCRKDVRARGAGDLRRSEGLTRDHSEELE